MTDDDFYAKLRADGVLFPAMKAPYGTKISKYIIEGVDHITSPDTGDEWLHTSLLSLFDAARELLGKPMPINAGSRTPAHERALAGAGYHTASFSSPHTLSALDIAHGSLATNADVLQAFKEAARAANLPAPRLGHKIYNETLVHVDLVYMFFAPFTAHPHPGTWPELDQTTRAKLDASWRAGVEW